jgi:tetratricopeptide (TPR) repeat protein
MIRIARLALLAFALLSIARPSRLHAQTARGYSITGHVYLQDPSHPAKQVTVTVQNVQHEYIISDVTSETGEFRFTGLKLAQYIVLVQVDEYEPVSLSLDLSFDAGNALAIYLKPLASKQKTPQGPPSVSVHELSMPAKAREFFASGQKKLYQDKNAQSSLADFQQALAIAPTYFEASYHLGMAYLTLGNPSEAEAAFRKSIESSGDTYPEADVRLGSLLLDRSNLPDAEKFIRKGIALNSNLWLAHYELGRTLLAQKRLPEALESAEHARLLAPSAPIVYRLLSNIHLLQNDFPALLEDLDAYVSLDPDSPAGLRAKELRTQVQQKIAAQHPTTAPLIPRQ